MSIAKITIYLRTPFTVDQRKAGVYFDKKWLFLLPLPVLHHYSAFASNSVDYYIH